MASITIQPTIKTEREAARSAIDIIKNPPKNPVEMMGWLSKNFSISGELTKTVSLAIPSLGKLLPIAGDIFAAFTSLSGPSIGDQLAEMANAIGGQINAAVEDIKNALTFSTEKTITAVIDQVQGISMDESALRVLQALDESDIFSEAEKAQAKIMAEYSEEISAVNQAWQSEISAAIDKARGEVDELYKQVQEMLSIVGIDLLKDIYDKLMFIQEDLAPIPSERALTAAPATTPLAPAIESNSAPLLIAGGVLVALLLAKKAKK